MNDGELPPIPVRSPRQLGQALARLRGLRGVTQLGVSRSAGVRQPTVSSVESGAPGTELATVFALLAALDLELVVRERVKRVAPPESRVDGG
ncbi:MAG: helix-turn-helix domain-containing protein [Trueperaceae bacterium]|nr:helix-turn-helix domain-containing protein [Trueperaceae bacterium]